MRTVYLQKDPSGSEFDLPACYAAWRGFNALLDDVRTFGDLTEVPPDPDVIVFGGVRTVRDALQRLRKEPPAPMDYPEELHPFLGRQVAQTTLGAVRRIEGTEDFKPVFIKPFWHTKLFTGHVIRQFRDLIATAGIVDTYPVWTSEVVEFVSEYRCFLLRGEIVGLRLYRGDSLVFPSVPTVRAAVAAWAVKPVACAIDFGVTPSGETLVVEVNDGFALGDYGLNPIVFARMIEARWDEMIARNG